MKQIKMLFSFLLVFICIIAFAGCNTDNTEAVGTPTEYFTVKFVSGGESEIEDIKVMSGSKIAEPPTPKKEGYIFNGWKNGLEDWNFGYNSVTSDITLKASWIDARTIFEYSVENDSIKITKYKGNLENLEIPDVMAGYKIETIGDRAFSGITSEKLKSVTLGKNIVAIGEEAFSGCSGVAINIEGALKSVGAKAFFGCDGLKRIEFASGAEKIPYASFSGCTSLTDVVLSNTLSLIEENAFEECSSLQKVFAYSSLKKIEDSAFNGCDAIAAIFYYGTTENFAGIDIALGNGGNDTFANANLYLYSESEPADADNVKYWYFNESGETRIW